MVIRIKSALISPHSFGFQQFLVRLVTPQKEAMVDEIRTQLRALLFAYGLVSLFLIDFHKSNPHNVSPGTSAPLISRVIGEFVKITPRVLSTWSHARPPPPRGRQSSEHSHYYYLRNELLRGCDAMTGSPPDDLVYTGKSRNTTSQQQKVRSYCNGTVCPVKLKSCAQRVIVALTPSNGARSRIPLICTCPDDVTEPTLECPFKQQRVTRRNSIPN